MLGRTPITIKQPSQKRKSTIEGTDAEVATPRAGIAEFTDTAVTKKTQLIGTGLAHAVLRVTPVDKPWLRGKKLAQLLEAIWGG